MYADKMYDEHFEQKLAGCGGWRLQEQKCPRSRKKINEMVRLIFILSIIVGFALRSNAQEINWDSLFVNNKSKEDSLRNLGISLNRYAEYWHIDSQANNGFRLLYGVELFEKVPMDCLPVDYLIFYLGKPYEIYEFDEECTIYKFLRLQEGNDPNKHHNYYAFLCFCVDPKTKIIEKSYFAFDGH